MSKDCPASARILRIAVPVPLRQLFDYLPPAGSETLPAPGCRVRVPFGRRQLIGVVVGYSSESEIIEARMKAAIEVLDQHAVIGHELRGLLDWAARYYQHPIGEVYAAALPALLRQGRPARVENTVWRLTPEGQAALEAGLAVRAPRQADIARTLAAHPEGLGPDAVGGPRDALRRMARGGLVAEGTQTTPTAISWEPLTDTGPSLNPAQAAAVDAIDPSAGFQTYLLDGVTGSGKTEVYLQLARAAMAEGKQTLVLVPEISLTPQLVQRFEARLGPSLAVSHSGLSDQERLAAWRSAGAGDAAVVIGTRSAVFAPLARPGLMIIDEEHDGSFKQQDGLRYSARDLAVYRARELDLPIVLGSATPSLESLHNVRRGRYQRLELPDRAGGAMPPRIGLIDLKREPAPQGLTPSLRQAMQRHLDAGNQVLLFINRRGYAPAFLCEDCGWVASCDRCDARMTLHRGAAQLRCHHCDRNRRQPERCPECEGALIAVGQGTQRVEETLASAFPDSPVIRIDRDATRRRGRLPELLDQAQSGAARILVGTQMLAKGHHFPEVTLAAILDADQGLYGSDLRAAERLAQLIVQVAGRAGRAERPGEVLIQTAWPEHPLLQRLIEHGYGPFADSALDERAAAGWPPITSLAVLRSEAPDEEMPMRFLTQAAESAPEVPGVTLLGPASATMGRRAGLYRCQLLAVGERASLINFLDTWMTAIDALPLGRKVRWSLDVDPIEVG